MNNEKKYSTEEGDLRLLRLENKQEKIDETVLKIIETINQIKTEQDNQKKEYQDSLNKMELFLATEKVHKDLDKTQKEENEKRQNRNLTIWGLLITFIAALLNLIYSLVTSKSE